MRLGLFYYEDVILFIFFGWAKKTNQKKAHLFRRCFRTIFTKNSPESSRSISHLNCCGIQ